LTQLDEKLKKFSAAIFKDAEEKRQQILKEIEDYRAVALEKAEQDILLEAYTLIQNEISDIKNQNSKSVSVKSMENRRNLIKKRDEITDRIFDEVKKRLIDYTKSPEYVSYLTKAAESSSKFDDAVIMLKKEDMGYGDIIIKTLGKQIPIQENKRISIGGIMIKSQKSGIIIDETLDERLKNQRTWFATNSNLTII
jgi:V/A-type H+-transporting ATPase subunit E